ncbi:hypothetical protein [Saprospira grandis]|uniref:hypothetical protein n=1 Tax=Saprospira grandis TaxID=1008 RepID=UPI0022DDBEB7|nr:hypothetical protein [Saprospira grandis]WBM73469.1 hypothetical protein OP864_10755 [Saprospira grandis]
MKAFATILIFFISLLNPSKMQSKKEIIAAKNSYQQEQALLNESYLQYKSLSELLAQLSPEDPEYQSFKAALTKAKKVLGLYKKQLAKEKTALETIIASFLGAQQEDIPKDRYKRLLSKLFANLHKKISSKIGAKPSLKGDVDPTELRLKLMLFFKQVPGPLSKQLNKEIKAIPIDTNVEDFLAAFLAILEKYSQEDQIKANWFNTFSIKEENLLKKISSQQLESILDQALAKDDFLTEEELEEKKNIVLKIQEEKNSINRWKDEEYLTWDDSINLANCLAPSYFPQVVANDYYADKYVKVVTIKNSLLQSLERLEQEGSLEEHKAFMNCGFRFSNYRVQSLREIFEAVKTERLVQLRSQLAYLEKNPNVKVDSQQLKSLLNGMSADPNDFIGQIMLLDISKLKAVTLSQIYTALGDAMTNYSALEGLIANEFPKRSIQGWTSFDDKFVSVIVLATVKPSPLQKIIQAWSEEYRDLFSNKLAKYKYRYFSRKTLERNAQNNLKISDFPELETLFQQTFKETLVEGEKLSYSEVASSWQAFLLELVIHKGINNLEQHQAAVQALEKAGIHALADSTKLEAIFQPIPLPKKEKDPILLLAENQFHVSWLISYPEVDSQVAELVSTIEKMITQPEEKIEEEIKKAAKESSFWEDYVKKFIKKGKDFADNVNPFSHKKALKLIKKNLDTFYQQKAGTDTLSLKFRFQHDSLDQKQLFPVFVGDGAIDKSADLSEMKSPYHEAAITGSTYEGKTDGSFILTVKLNVTEKPTDITIDVGASLATFVSVNLSSSRSTSGNSKTFDFIIKGKITANSSEQKTESYNIKITEHLISPSIKNDPFIKEVKTSFNKKELTLSLLPKE